MLQLKAAVKLIGGFDFRFLDFKLSPISLANLNAGSSAGGTLDDVRPCAPDNAFYGMLQVRLQSAE